jgi:hypothetical protein
MPARASGRSHWPATWPDSASSACSANRPTQRLLLTKELLAACLAVGFDPYIGLANPGKLVRREIHHLIPR